jgi:hypothetical protein
VSGKISGVKTTSKRVVRPAKKIKISPATASEILEALHVTELDKRRARAALAAVMSRNRASAPKRGAKISPKAATSTK